MGKFAVTLKDGKTVHINAPNEAAAMEHANKVAASFADTLHVGPKTEGQGHPNQLQRHGDPVKADNKKPVSAVQVK